MNKEVNKKNPAAAVEEVVVAEKLSKVEPKEETGETRERIRYLLGECVREHGIHDFKGDLPENIEGLRRELNNLLISMFNAYGNVDDPERFTNPDDAGASNAAQRVLDDLNTKKEAAEEFLDKIKVNDSIDIVSLASALTAIAELGSGYLLSLHERIKAKCLENENALILLQLFESVYGNMEMAELKRRERKNEAVQQSPITTKVFESSFKNDKKRKEDQRNLETGVFTILVKLLGNKDLPLPAPVKDLLVSTLGDIMRQGDCYAHCFTDVGDDNLKLLGKKGVDPSALAVALDISSPDIVSRAMSLGIKGNPYSKNRARILLNRLLEKEDEDEDLPLSSRMKERVIRAILSDDSKLKADIAGKDIRVLEAIVHIAREIDLRSLHNGNIFDFEYRKPGVALRAAKSEMEKRKNGENS